MKISRQILLLALINGLALLLALSLTAMSLSKLRKAFSAYAQDQAVLYQLTEIKAATLAASRADMLAPTTPQQLADTDQLVKSRWQALRAEFPEDQAKAADVAIMENWADFLKNFNSAIQIFASAPQDALSIPERIYPMYIAPLNQMLDQLLAQHQQTAETHRTEIGQQINQLLWVVLTPLLIAGLVMLAFQMRFGQRIRQRVDAMGAIAAQLATGDLSHRLPEKGGDEISELATRFNHFINSFEHILRDVKRAAADVHRHTQEVTRKNQVLGEHSNKQSTELNETNRAISEISAAISEIAHSAASASDSTSSVRNMSEHSSSLGGHTTRQLGELGNSVQLAAERLGKLSEAITQIGNVSALIKDIANQTNLLALNAAIEAARAGEHGRGFAVVADEVRGLSERTAESTGRIEELLQQVWLSSADTVEAIRHAEQQAQHSREQGDSMASNIDETMRAISQVSGMLDGIASATEQHSAATGNIRELIDKASQVAHEVASELQNAQEDLSQLQDVATQLQQATDRFRLSA